MTMSANRSDEDRGPSILCPVDFSEASRSALRYAAAIAARMHASLTVMTVEDPLLAALETQADVTWPTKRAHKALVAEAAETLSDRTSPLALRFEPTVGQPAAEIRRVAAERRADLIVMGSHGLTGVRKLFFGSTTERVLRETSTPVLITRPTTSNPPQPDEVAPLVNRILVPVDFGAATSSQLPAAEQIARALNIPILLAHIIQPIRSPFWHHREPPSIDASRRERAEKMLEELAAAVSPSVHADRIVDSGDPAEQIAGIARDRDAQLIVIGLRESEPGGPRIGSVTYRVICLTSSLVLALPPGGHAPASRLAARASH
jgi:nucleotide-binding universal stress UspA family protein